MNQDSLERFIFTELDLRGQIASLNDSYLDAIAGHDYPGFIKRLVGEALAAVALLSSNLKFPGTVSIQVQGDGEVQLLMAECRENHYLRATVRSSGIQHSDSFLSSIGRGVLAINIEPESGQRYQGLVPLEKNSLAACLEDYFWQSEQLHTKLILTATNEVAKGLMIQALPKSDPLIDNQEGWNRIAQLTSTLGMSELLNSPHHELLFKLYHEEQVKLFAPYPLSFSCTCSKEKFLSTLVAMDEAETSGLLSDENNIVTHCHFCNTEYIITKEDIASASISNQSGRATPTLH